MNVLSRKWQTSVGQKRDFPVLKTATSFSPILANGYKEALRCKLKSPTCKQKSFSSSKTQLNNVGWFSSGKAKVGDY